MRLSTAVMRRLAGFPKLAGVRIYGMRRGITLTVDAADRARLEAVVADRNRSQKHVWRARIILLTADGVGTTGIERRTGKDKTCVWTTMVETRNASMGYHWGRAGDEP